MAFGTVWHGDGREQALLKHILNHPNADELRGQPDSILAEIDRWAVQNNLCMMTIGPERSSLVVDVIRNNKPTTMAELGGYIGYSAIKFASEMRKTGGTQYLSLENDAHYASVAQALIDFAGLNDFVRIYLGPSSESLAKLSADGVRIDVLFIDHDDGLYLKDLQLAEELGLLDTGSVIVADNTSGPRAQPYVLWVNQAGLDGKYQSQTLPYRLSNGQPDAMLITNKI